MKHQKPTKVNGLIQSRLAVIAAFAVLILGGVRLAAQDQSNEISCSSASACRAGSIPKFATSGGSATVNSSNVFQSTTGNIGVGTKTPYARLDVRGTNSTLINVGDPNMVAVFDNGTNATNIWTNVLPTANGGTDTNYYFAENGTGVGGIRWNVLGGYVALITDTSPGGLNNEPFVLQGRNVGIGTLTPANNLEVGTGATTLADAWTTRSSRRFKTNIHPLMGALEKVTQIQGVSYERKVDGKPEIGVIAEDINQIVPEVVSRDPKTNEVQGVDYSRLSALLIEAVKVQQVEIEQLRSELQKVAARP